MTRGRNAVINSKPLDGYICFFRTVIVQKLTLLAKDRPEESLDLTGDLGSIKKKVRYE